ncbi:MAG TPA: rhodanese-like domain-containing protein [Syntrophales bacterium]|nr:rhodanese-like domain-containing protein [Syntrophales bacterium]HLE41280.1 rhodanese-like domain-containing protein [Nitrospirota bacterium]
MARKLSFLFSVVAVFFLFACAARIADKTPAQLVTEAKSQIKEVSIQDVKMMIDAKEKVIILDVRDNEEYEGEHLPGAINMSRGKLDFHIHELIPDKTAKVVVY